MENCEANGSMYSHPLYMFAMLMQGASGYLAFPMMFLLLKKHALKVNYHSNLVFVMSLNVVSCLILAGLTAWSATNFFISIIFKASSCDLLMRTDFCSKFRATFLFAFCLVTTSHAGILIERIWATINVKFYERQGKILGVILAILAVSVSAISIFIVIQNEDKDELITTCLTFSASKSVGNQIYSMFLVQLILDGIISVAHFILYKYNIHNKIQNASTLSEQFQRKENVKTLKQVSPLLILSNVTIGVYIFVISVVRLYKNYLPTNWYEIIAALLFIMPHMPLMFSTLLFIEFRKEKKRHIESHRKMMANRDIPLADQFHISIGDWESRYESRNGSSPNANSNSARHALSFFRKHQSTVEVNVIS